eukprot:Pgem_evm1s14693
MLYLAFFLTFLTAHEVRVIQAREKYWHSPKQRMVWKRQSINQYINNDVDSNTKHKLEMNVTEYCDAFNSKTNGIADFSLIKNNGKGWEWSRYCSLASQSFSFYNDELEDFQQV